MSAPTGILIVYSGDKPPAGHRLRLCIDKVREHTHDEPYRLYVWNNTGDPEIGPLLAASPHATLLNQQPMPVASDHPAPRALSEGACLQRLHQAVRADGARYVVAMEADAHPVRSGWLKELTSALDRGAALAGAWNDAPRRGARCLGRAVCLCASVEFLEKHGLQLIQWMRGSRDFVFVLGMHRSGTSCVAGALERCGLFLGDVSRSNVHNVRGNQELPAVIELHERILRTSGGSWSSPPQKMEISASDRQAMRAVVDQLAAHAPCGLKEPRMLLFLPYWLELAGSVSFVGSFRHPAAVAQSLARRDRMPVAQAHELWLCYNRKLIELHRQHAFPLLEFDLAKPDAFCENVAGAAVRLGLRPDLEGVRQFVSRELDHSALSEQSVPTACEDAYGYLREHRYRIDSFERALMELSSRLPTPPERRGKIGGYLCRLGRRLVGRHHETAGKRRTL